MNAIEVIIGELLGGAAKLALSLDQDHQQHLVRLEGQSLRIHCTNPPQRLTLRVAGGELAVLPGSDNPTDATVTGTLTDLIALLRGDSPGQALRVNGDPTVLRDFARLFEGYDPDWAGLIPKAPGDFGPGSPSGRPGEAVFEQLRGVAEVGLASLGKALGTALSSGQEQVRRAAGEHFSQEAEAQQTSQRLQQLQRSLESLRTRIDALDSAPNHAP
ncbi:MAG: SCP2 sterol-binding domain-containing protein [Pseudomonadales bacterium]